MFRQDRKLKPNSFIDVEFNVGERPEIGEWYVEAAFATTVSRELLLLATCTNARWSTFIHARSLHVLSEFSTK